jgi:hypothetical protein
MSKKKSRFQVRKKLAPVPTKAHKEAEKAIREGKVREFLRKAGLPLPENGEITSERSEQPS